MDDEEPVESASAAVVRRVAEGAAVDVAGGLLALAVGGVGGGAVGLGTGALFSAVMAVRGVAADRAARAVERGAGLAGLTADELAAWIESDPRHAGLLVAVVEAAARSTAETHLDALARVFADGAGDDARVDLDTLAARALGMMGPAHVQVLTLVAEEDAKSAEGGPASAYTLEHLERRRPGLGVSGDALMAGLLSTGAARTDATTWGRIGEVHYAVTAFGRECLAFLDDRASAAT